MSDWSTSTLTPSFKFGFLVKTSVRDVKPYKRAIQEAKQSATAAGFRVNGLLQLSDKRIEECWFIAVLLDVSETES